MRSKIHAACLAALMLGAVPVTASAAPSPFFGKLFGQRQTETQLAQAGDARVGQMEEQMRQITGRIEDLAFQLLQIQEQLRKMQEDTEFRFQELEGGTGGTGGSGGSGGSGGGGQGGGEKRRGAIESPDAPDASEAPEAPVREAAREPAPQSELEPESEPESESESGAGGSDTIGALIGSHEGDGMPMDGGGAPNGEDRLAEAPGARDEPLRADGSGLSPRALGSLQFDANGNVLGATLDKPIELVPPPAAPEGGGRLAALEEAKGPAALYEASLARFEAGDYKAAEAGFNRFAERHPSDARLGDARFWLGESLFSQGRYEESAKVLLDAHKRFPKSRLAPQTLLRLGSSLAGMNQRELACATYAEVPKKYPDMSGAVRSRVTAEQKAARCVVK